MARVERVARLNEGARVGEGRRGSARVGEGERGSARVGEGRGGSASVELSRHPFLYEP